MLHFMRLASPQTRFTQLAMCSLTFQDSTEYDLSTMMTPDKSAVKAPKSALSAIELKTPSVDKQPARSPPTEPKLE